MLLFSTTRGIFCSEKKILKLNIKPYKDLEKTFWEGGGGHFHFFFLKFWKRLGGLGKLFYMPLFSTTRGTFISEKKFLKLIIKPHRDFEKFILDLFGPRFIRA